MKSSVFTLANADAVYLIIYRNVRYTGTRALATPHSNPFRPLYIGGPRPSRSFPKSGGKEFSCLDYTATSSTFDEDARALFCGHAIRPRSLAVTKSADCVKLSAGMADELSPGYRCLARSPAALMGPLSARKESP